MKGTVLDLIRGKKENYILPFFWQHGESEETLREYMRVIKASNIDEVCLEARPHPDYAGEGWFHDVEIILDEAKKLNMKLWILDDAHFPSGQCAGKLDQYDDSYHKLYLNYHSADVTGPVSGARLSVGTMAKYYENPFSAGLGAFFQKSSRTFTDDRLRKVFMARLDGKPGDLFHLDDAVTDLTGLVCDGELCFDVPEGPHRIFVLYETRNGGGRGGYVNFLSEKSCRVQIDTCYEPHYRRFGKEFGKTILGFFSDEPEIGNIPGYSGGAIGTKDMPLPWSEELEKELCSRLGENYLEKLLACWNTVGSSKNTADIRVAYMDAVTCLCGKNFAGQIGAWCREHGVQYIGHVVEDNDQHTKLCCSQGHYFRALWGQDWAGVDDIGGQVLLGGANVAHKGVLNMTGDGEFYHHVLGKLGTSLADIDPKKHGNTMCEIFGAYGWNEGTRLMLYEINHFLARGINHFVPHAFSPKAFPDPDCPPHFYAQGKNPLYKPFGTLMKYTNRVCSLISDGSHRPDAAILYHAESEWSGGTYMDIAKPSRILDENQIDFCYLPADVFTDPEQFDAKTENGLTVNGHSFGALLIPGADFVPDAVLDFAEKAAGNGFPVLFVGQAPAGYEDTFSPVPLGALADTLRNSLPGIPALSPAADYLTVFRYEKEDEQYLLINNESPGTIYQGTVSASEGGTWFRYDAFAGQLYRTDSKKTERGQEISLTIHPYELLILVRPVPAGSECSRNRLSGMPESDDVTVAAVPAANPEDPYSLVSKEEERFAGTPAVLPGPYQVSFCLCEDYPAFSGTVTMDQPEDILNIHPDFSGIIRYETTFQARAGDALLTLTDCYESAEVFVNGILQGERIAPPYVFTVRNLKEGTNTLTIEVRTTLERLVHKMTGGMTPFGPEMNVILPEGLTGPVTLIQ